jgi:ABC-type sugar transport system permease subunit
MTRGGPGSSSLVGSVYAFSIFQGGDLGQTAAFGILLLIIVNLVVTVFIRYLWRQERQMHTRQAAAP